MSRSPTAPNLSISCSLCATGTPVVAPPRRGTGRSRRALTVAQVEALADAAREDRVLVLVLAYCGLRPNEAFALRRRHRDDFGQLVIEGGLVEVRGRQVETDGKTHQQRVVPPSPLRRR